MHASRTARRLPVLLLAAAACPLLAPPAHAGEGKGTGPSGQTITVSRTDGLPAKGTEIQVKGSGFDPAKGIYVALCKDNGPGKAPSPCGGGADTSGGTGASQWISSNPPPYGKGLAVPYGPGGTFAVELHVGSALTGSETCAKVRCVVTSRADHTRTSDRSQDVKVPVAFQEGGDGTSAGVWAGAVVGVAVIAVGAGAVLLRRRRAGAGAAS
ncbi:hypothetical protein [Actinomadura roseirufa]|uniref:hypothetical protein n=1 Tax=Actinomadura roseirufa TaxID=2094049 RepID=UPI001F5F09AA|nr:hypothetical protein [Actinomadura roseirufa]